MEYNYREEYQKWLESPALSEAEWKELHDLEGDESEIRARFYAPLEFGTAGLRGTMKPGLHNMNVHVIRHATQAFADVISAEGEEAKKKGIVIAHDCRRNSKEFAREAACVMAANGISVRLFDELRPTPELSFSVIAYGAAAGLNITASHNPKEYNGYKVYWSDGAQLPPQKAAAIAKRMEETDLFNGYRSCDFLEAVDEGKIRLLGEETDEAFLARVMKESIAPEKVEQAGDALKIVYTPFHGCGYRLVPEALRRLGVQKLYPVKEQMVIDGSFPTVESPNPENPEGFALAIALAKQTDSTLIIGTDPDSDRIGVLARAKDGSFVPITGNQLGVLLLDYIICARREKGTLPENAGAVASIVTTGMARAVAEKNGVHFEETFTGFKFMAERVAKWDALGTWKYILAYEESYGYMVGDYVRDKDAVTASVLTAEMAAAYALRGMTLLDAVDELYERYGYFREKTINLVMPGLDGLEKMHSLMSELRKNPPAEIGGESVVSIRDYSDGSRSIPGLGKVGPLELKGSDVLYYDLADGSSFIVRPSGTEPKIKLYILARGESEAACEGRIAACMTFAETLKR